MMRSLKYEEMTNEIKESTDTIYSYNRNTIFCHYSICRY